jgi:hypothetical protein
MFRLPFIDVGLNVILYRNVRLTNLDKTGFKTSFLAGLRRATLGLSSGRRQPSRLRLLIRQRPLADCSRRLYPKMLNGARKNLSSLVLNFVTYLWDTKLVISPRQHPNLRFDFQWIFGKILKPNMLMCIITPHFYLTEAAGYTKGLNTPTP